MPLDEIVSLVLRVGDLQGVDELGLSGLDLCLQLALHDHGVQRVAELGQLVPSAGGQDVGRTTGRDLRGEPGVAADRGHEVTDQDGDHGQAEDQDGDDAGGELQQGGAVGRVGVLARRLGEGGLASTHPLPSLDDVGEDLVDLVGEARPGRSVQAARGGARLRGQLPGVQVQVRLKTLPDPLEL